MGMQVGHIPALTWNRLGVNYAQVNQDLTLNTKVETHFSELGEEFVHTVMSQEKADAWLKDHAPEEKAESVTAGKTPLYHPQTFGTGLGAEYGEFIASSGTPVDFLEITKGTQQNRLLLWEIHYPDGSKSATSQIIHVGEGAKVSILFVFRSPYGSTGLAGISTRIVLDKGAELLLVKAQILGENFLFFDDTGASLGEGASLQMIQTELGAGEAYLGVQTELIGDRSSFDAKASYLGVDKNEIDLNYNVVQRGKKTNSSLQFDGVLADESRKTFRGTIDFRKGSCGSKGTEKENVLLLSDDAVNKTLPIILCEEEDMEGSHGATIGRLDDEILFYFASRGIDEKEAEKMMVQARLCGSFSGIPDKDLYTELSNAAEEAFGNE